MIVVALQPSRGIRVYTASVGDPRVVLEDDGAVLPLGVLPEQWEFIVGDGGGGGVDTMDDSNFVDMQQQPRGSLVDSRIVTGMPLQSGG